MTIILHLLTLHRKLLLYRCLIEIKKVHSLRRKEPEIKMSLKFNFKRNYKNHHVKHFPFYN